MNSTIEDKSYNDGIIPVRQKFSFMQRFDVIRAMIGRNFILWKRFKISAVTSIISMFVGIGVFFFVNYWIGDAMGIRIAEFGYQGDFFRYVLLGMAVTSFSTISLTFFLFFLKATYFSNWLEMIISSSISLQQFVSITLIWMFFLSTINLTLYIGIGTFFFGADIILPPDFWLLIVIIVLLIISISGIGLISASMFLLFDVKGNIEPVGWFFMTFPALVSGNMFPPALFLEIAPPLYYLSKIFPLTYALESFRRVMDGQNLSNPIVMNNIMILLLFCIICLPIGLLFFRKGIKVAEKTGKLARWGA